MIIEDDRLVADDIAAGVTAGGGIVVAYAATEQEAVDAAQRVDIDLLLSDVRLADGSDGINASAKIRARHAAHVAFVTASTDDDTMNRMRRLNPLAIVHKPIAEAEIIALLDQLQVLRRRVAPPAPPELDQSGASMIHLSPYSREQ
jgi:two-component system, response regulator PdtaR